MFKFLIGCGVVVALVWYGCGAIKEGARRYEMQNCLESQKICVEYWGTHKGKCLECREMERCEKKGLI